MPKCWVIAGPNGAGKTTFALPFLRDGVKCSRFVNVDLIAAGLSPLKPERDFFRATRLFHREMKRHFEAGVDFAFETTLAGRGTLTFIKHLKNAGWQVDLIYLALPNLNMSRMRVAERVAHGGHSISDEKLVRRFPRSLAHLLGEISRRVDHCVCLMNNSEQPSLVFEQRGRHRQVFHPKYYRQLCNQADS